MVCLEIEEVRLLNSIEASELDSMDLARLWDRKAIKYSCINGSSGKSFGCQDYMTRIFQTFVDTAMSGS